MNLAIPPETKVFRDVTKGGNKGRWHILRMVKDNGFTQKLNPSRPLWWGTKTYIAVCLRRLDNRLPDGGTVEFSTVGEIKKVCPSCWPFQKVENESINQTGD